MFLKLKQSGRGDMLVNLSNISSVTKAHEGKRFTAINFIGGENDYVVVPEEVETVIEQIEQATKPQTKVVAPRKKV